MGAIGGVGHYFGDDKDLCNRGRRDAMGDEQIKKILEIMSLGQTEVNFKVHTHEIINDLFKRQFGTKTYCNQKSEKYLHND